MIVEKWLKLGSGGRVVLPAAIRQELHVTEGDRLVAWMDGEVLNLTTPEAAVRLAQRLVQSFATSGPSPADELLNERRREVEGG